MFRVESERFGEFTKLKLVNTDSGEYVSTIPDFGGNVNEINLNRRGRIYSILDGYSTPDEIKKHKGFKGDKLIPFPNRIRDGRYSFNGSEYFLPINDYEGNNAIHGFIWNKRLRIEKELVDNSSSSVQLSYLYDGDIPGYPFKFKLLLTYYLMKNQFKCKTEIINIDDIEIPIGDGWHPYFKMNSSIDKIMLKVPATRVIEVDSRKLPTHREIFFDRFVELNEIGNSELDLNFRISSSNGIFVTEIYNPEDDLKINLWQETGKRKYNYLQIYTPPSRRSISIEPMTCGIDAFNNRSGLIVLTPGESFMTQYGVFLTVQK